ncbi:nucleotidyltransferase family protein [Haladaptatus sp. CMSO5]|uniref:nucleotidyltransferase family protein n=1 Tax=Haladaptatus sp. CMSO5 TaxID=3120514 RepID=UPI002FCE4BCE
MTTDSQQVCGVLLAAGTSTRFGAKNKLLEPIDGVPLVRRSAATLVEAGLTPLIAVVGHESVQVRDALDGLDFEIIENESYPEGQATSVRAAAQVLTERDTVDAAVFALGDMPYVSVATIRSLVSAYEAGEGTALAAAYEGVRGNPVLFDRQHFQALGEVDGDTGGKAVFKGADQHSLVETDDPGVRIDIDTTCDLDTERPDQS